MLSAGANLFQKPLQPCQISVRMHKEGFLLLFKFINEHITQITPNAHCTSRKRGYTWNEGVVSNVQNERCVSLQRLCILSWKFYLLLECFDFVMCIIQPKLCTLLMPTLETGLGEALYFKVIELMRNSVVIVRKLRLPSPSLLTRN